MNGNNIRCCGLHLHSDRRTTERICVTNNFDPIYNIHPVMMMETEKNYSVTIISCRFMVSQIDEGRRTNFRKFRIGFNREN